jgi:hypothetical protein
MVHGMDCDSRRTGGEQPCVDYGRNEMKKNAKLVLLSVSVGILLTFLPCWFWSGFIDRFLAAAVISLIIIGSVL